MNLIDDAVDLAAYGRTSGVEAKVRKASDFGSAMYNSFEPRAAGVPDAPGFLLNDLRRRIRFRPGEVTAWSGFNGHRKSLLTSQLLLDCCVQRVPSLAMSFEMLPVETLSRMTRIAAGVATPSRDYRGAFSRWTDGRFWILDHLGRYTADETLAVCRYFAQELGGRQVVIDSMMMVCASEEHLDEQKQFVTDCVTTAQETGLHIHLVTHARKGDETKPPSKYDIRGSSAISDQVANVVMVWSDKAKKERVANKLDDEATRAKPDAIVKIEKQRNGSFEGSVALWWDEASLRFLGDRTSPIEPYLLAEPMEPEPIEEYR